MSTSFIIMHRFTRISWSLSSSSTGISGGSPAGRSKMSNEAAARPLLRCAFASDISCFSSSVLRSLNWNCGDWLDGYAPLAFYLGRLHPAKSRFSIFRPKYALLQPMIPIFNGVAWGESYRCPSNACSMEKVSLIRKKHLCSDFLKHDICSRICRV